METKKIKLQPIILILIAFLLVGFTFVMQLNINPTSKTLAFAEDNEKENIVSVDENDLACKDLVVDEESKLIYLTEGLYYIDLEANSASTRIGLNISKQINKE